MAGGATQAGIATGNPYAAAAGFVIDAFSGDSITSSMGMGSARLNMNTSAAVVGKGDANGGNLTDTIQNAAAWPWYVWVVGGLVAIAIIKKAHK